MTSVAPNAGGTDRLFSTAEARLERWSTLVSAAHAWAVKSDKAGRVAVETALAELRPAESFFAYPGPRLLRAIDEEIAQGDGGDVARLVRRMYNALLSSSYPAGSADWGTAARCTCAAPARARTGEHTAELPAPPQLRCPLL